MGMAISLERYLEGRGVPYDLLPHQRTLDSSATARAAAIPPDNLAKGVLVKHREGYLLAIVPASRQVSLDDVGALCERPVGLATESEVADVFRDCEWGAVPPVAGAYGIQAVMDDSLEGFKDIYFEAGDHCTLVHVRGTDFHRLMSGVPQAHISTASH
jgi:Ala-tRNA(Pro) deacylase